MRFVNYSFPRSGSCWVRYIFNTLLGFPQDNSPENYRNQPIPYIKYHDFKDGDEDFFVPNGPKRNRSCNGLILLIRNYKECIIRHSLQANAAHLYTSIPQYISAIIFFEEFKGPKILIYYEELMANPQKEILRLGQFINECSEYNVDDEVEKFLTNLKYHQQQSLESHPCAYANQTSGKKEYHYIYHLTKHQSKVWDYIIKYVYPEQYKKYLKRYRGHPKQWFFKIRKMFGLL